MIIPAIWLSHHYGDSLRLLRHPWVAFLILQICCWTTYPTKPTCKVSDATFYKLFLDLISFQCGACIFSNTTHHACQEFHIGWETGTYVYKWGQSSPHKPVLWGCVRLNHKFLIVSEPPPRSVGPPAIRFPLLGHPPFIYTHQA